MIWTQFLSGAIFGFVFVLMIQYFLRKIKTIYRNMKEPKDCEICGLIGDYADKQCNCKDPKVIAFRETDEFKEYIKTMFGEN